MAFALRRFGPPQMILGAADGWRVLEFFFPLDMDIAADDLTPDDLSLAQGLLLAALDETRRLTAEAPPPPEGTEETQLVAAGWVKNQAIFARFARRANPDWFANQLPEGAFPHAVSEVARARLAIPFRAIWISRVHGAPLL